MTEFKHADDDAPDALELQIQRLVDGELVESDTPSLLKELESSDDGWRRCALAFVESQVWSESVGAINISSAADGEASNPAESDGVTISMPAANQEDSRASYSHFAWLAASLLLAFVLGRQMRPVDSDFAPPSNSDVAVTAPSGRGGGGAGDRLLPYSFDNGQELGEVTMRVGGENDARTITLPVFAGSPDTEAAQTSFLSQDVIRRLQDAGIDVQRSVSFQPVEVGEEGVMFIPVEHVDFGRRPRLIP